MGTRIGNRMMAFMSRKMIACDEASFLVSYNHENRLGFGKWWRLKMHLITCHLCRKYVHQIRELDRAVKSYRIVSGQEQCKHHLSEEACSKIRNTVQSELNAK